MSFHLPSISTFLFKVPSLVVADEVGIADSPKNVTTTVQF